MNQDELKEYMNDIKRSLEEHTKDDKQSFKDINSAIADFAEKTRKAQAEMSSMLYKIVGGLVLAGILAQIYFGHH